ncbi:MAG: SHOCT domain-containing protein [Solidesulfovibrio sp. DCME]|uniref:SHOCT domain-containing protein n=1 Tax=Solidesulfovibrio sp. DCME TaxID=3447380 RepID=UPI003D11C1AA
MELAGIPHSIFGIPLDALLVSAVLLFLLLVVGLGVRRQHHHQRRQTSAKADRDDALRLLRSRLECGAISQTEFERLRRSLES